MKLQKHENISEVKITGKIDKEKSIIHSNDE
jgi:hypothetical protein